MELRALDAETPSLEARVDLREFARTTNLPLVERGGPLVYVVLNVALAISSAVLTGFHRT
jgi:hypothetical protein